MFLNEVGLREPSGEGFREFIDDFRSLRGDAEPLGLTSDIFRLVAEPWLSIEEATVVFVFEASDAAQTLPAYGALLANGLLRKHKLSQLVDWDAAATFVEGL